MQELKVHCSIVKAMESYNEEDRELKRDVQRAGDETKDALDEA
jgi:hypothetical protein